MMVRINLSNWFVSHAPFAVGIFIGMSYVTYYIVSPILFAFDIWTQSYAEFLKREFSYESYTLFTYTFSQGRSTASYGFHHICITTF